MNDVAGESPTQDVLEQAAEHELGGWVERTFSPVESMFARRFREWRLYFFEHGLIIKGENGHYVYDWATTRVLESLRSVNGKMADARYTLFGTDGVAVSIGLGVDALLGRQRGRLGITSFEKGAPFTGPGDWGPHIQENVAIAQLPGALKTIAQGDTVDFGAIKVGPTGVTVKKRTAAWNDIGKVHVANGLVSFAPPGDRGPGVLSPVSATEVVNLTMFLTLAQQMES